MRMVTSSDVLLIGVHLYNFKIVCPFRQKNGKEKEKEEYNYRREQQKAVFTATCIHISHIRIPYFCNKTLGCIRVSGGPTSTTR